MLVRKRYGVVEAKTRSVGGSEARKKAWPPIMALGNKLEASDDEVVSACGRLLTVIVSYVGGDEDNASDFNRFGKQFMDTFIP